MLLSRWRRSKKAERVTFELQAISKEALSQPTQPSRRLFF
jgi:hypothetical protein